MLRRLIAALGVLVCLFGIVQPAFACATASPDCCPAGTPAGCSDQQLITRAQLELNDCCAARPAFASSVLVTPRGRAAFEHASGSPDPLIQSPAFSIRPNRSFAQATARPLIFRLTDESLTYLRTARLRL